MRPEGSIRRVRERASRFVVCYDIVDGSRRRRIAKVLEGAGRRVGLSVFELELDQSELKQLVERITPLLAPATDRVQIYRLCPRSMKEADLLGVPWLDGLEMAWARGNSQR